MSPPRSLALTGGAVALPNSPSAADQGWQFAGIYRASASALIGSDGSGVASFAGLDSGNRWRISRAAISCSDGDSATALTLYIVAAGHPVTEGVFVSGTTCGLSDECDYPGDDGLVVFGGEQLLAEWTAATPGAAALITIQYELDTQAS